MKSSFSLSRMKLHLLAVLALLSFAGARAQAQTLVYLLEVPDYEWYAGCFGTASGNMAGFWDRHGMADFYTGPTAGGVAPLNSFGANGGIRSLYASKAGVDGRPANQYGHIDNYYSSGNGNVYDQSTAADPYVLAGRAEHAPDCIGDFIGLNQKKWTDMAGECDGNIDAYSFVFWDKSGNRRVNYSHTNPTGQYIPDLQSGYKTWARHRGYDADVFTQLSDFNPERTAGAGFTYEDVKAEIDAGYPVLCFLQGPSMFRNFSGQNPPMPKANPEIHGVMIYGYFSDPFSGIDKGVIIRTSWASGGDPGYEYQQWTGAAWLGLYPVRGVIGFHPTPKIINFSRADGTITLNWHGPSARVYDEIAGSTTLPHRYCVQRATALNPANWTPVGEPTTALSATVPDVEGTAFYRVVLIGQGNCP